MIILVDDNSQFQQYIGSLFKAAEQETTLISTISELDEVLQKYETDVVILGSSIPAETAIKQAAHLSVSYPHVSSILAVEAIGPDLLREAMRAGVKDIIESGMSDEQVLSSISRALEIAGRFKASIDIKEESSEGVEAPKLGKVITFFSTKGGVGKSVLSTNSAVALAKSTGKRVVILDLDLQFGDVGIMLQMVPTHTIYDVVQAIDHIDEDMLQGLLTTHSSGLKALLAPVRPHESDSITPAHIKAIIDLLKNFFDFIVIDTYAAFSDIILTALDSSDQICLIATMDMPSIKNIKLAIQTIKQLGYPPEIIKFILNRADSKVWLEIDEVEESLGLSAHVKVPSDRVVPRSVNKGIPIVIEEPKSAVAKSIIGFTESLVNIKTKAKSQPDESKPEPRKLIRRFI